MSDLSFRILNSLAQTIYTTDLEGRITSANRSWSDFAQLNGAPALAMESSVRGRSLWEAFSDASYREQVRSAMEQLQRGDAAMVTWEFPCSSPTEERVFLMQITALRDATGVISGFVFCTVDITPSHKSREALMDSALALSRTLDLDRVFEEVGEQTLRGTPATAFAVWQVNSDATTRLAYESSPEISTVLFSAATDSLKAGEVTVLEASGELLIAAPMCTPAGVVGVMATACPAALNRHEVDEIVRVLTTMAAQTGAAIERSSLVARVGHKRRLEAIGEVASGVAHEIRNPLFGISSAAQLLLFRARDDAVVEKNVGRILREVDRLNRMVTSLLDFGRPRPLVATKGYPDAIWDACVDDQHGLLDARAVRVRREVAVPGVACEFDAEQLGQVFLNLLVNAVDHAPAGSTVSAASSVTPGFWVFRLTNSGPPIPPDAIPRVFEMFYSTKPLGTGIGLSLCQRILEEHGGSIRVEGSDEHGTTIAVLLPLARD